MAKFYGKIGYKYLKEKVQDVWSDNGTERNYYGDVLQSYRRWESGEGLNDNTNINNRISIVADPFAYDHFSKMCYVEWMGVKWKITNIEIQRPRLILTLGGVYNENEIGTERYS